MSRAVAMASVLLGVSAASSLGCIPKKPLEPHSNQSPQASQTAPARPSVGPSHTFNGFRRGINLGNALDAPREGEWGVVLTEQHFKMAREAGLDHVRLPVRFNAHAQEAAPFAVSAELWKRVDWALAEARANQLSVVLDFHHYNELMEAPEQHADRFVGIWKQIAERYRDEPDSVSFELLNEPHKALDPVKWNLILNRAISEIRRTNPHRWLVVDSYSWSAVEYLKALDLPPKDTRLVATFHFYQPILFTHQGAHWMDPEYATVGVVFPGPPKEPIEPAPSAQAVGWVKNWFESYNQQAGDSNPGGGKVVERLFDIAEAYREASGRPVYLGEFGAIDRADAASRETYVRLVRQEAERRQIGWAYWDDGGSFQAMKVKEGAWVPYLRRALLD